MQLRVYVYACVYVCVCSYVFVLYDMPKSVRVPLSRCTHFKAQPRTHAHTHTHSHTQQEAYTQPSSATTPQQQQEQEHAARPGQSVSALGTQLIQLLIQPHLNRAPATHFACHQTHN